MSGRKDSRSWPKGIIKGGIGEAIVEAILAEAGNEVKRFGKEWLSTKCASLAEVNFAKTPRSLKARLKPDFAIRTKAGEKELVESKFLITDAFLYHWDVKELEALCSLWPGTSIVVVALDADCTMQVLRPPYFDYENGTFLTKPIYDIPEWGITSQIYPKYDAFIRDLPVQHLQNDKQGGA